MTTVVCIPNKQYEVFCAGSDKKIWNNNMSKQPFEVDSIISQLQVTHNGKALFAGVGEQDKPGAIQIFKISENAQGEMKVDKINEIQAHSKKIERMRLSYDNHHLFTVGADGCFYIHDVKDRDPKGK
jgi:WD40 repeat protein